LDKVDQKDAPVNSVFLLRSILFSVLCNIIFLLGLFVLSIVKSLLFAKAKKYLLNALCYIIFCWKIDGAGMEAENGQKEVEE
jgi:hypothetical protein